jgi:hypothetical protein
MRGILPLVLICLACRAFAQGPAAPSPPPCSAAAYRQFDFWLGLWHVRNHEGEFAGVNRIEAIDHGCALRETWSSGGGRYTGTSLNWYGPDGRWHQTWVDSSGQQLELRGGLEGAAMVLEGQTPAADPKRPPVRQRISWQQLDADRVRQVWELSADEGKFWTTAFDGVYHRVRTAGTGGGGIMSELAGQWIGTGEIFGARVAVQLSISPWVDARHWHLHWMNLGAPAAAQLFEGHGVYHDLGQGAYEAHWWDSQGATHTVRARTEGRALTALWGKRGRTQYMLRDDGTLEVIDSVKAKGGGWREFGRSRLTRK